MPNERRARRGAHPPLVDSASDSGGWRPGFAGMMFEGVKTRKEKAFRPFAEKRANALS
ncbi:hypothetical protein [Sphingopyxis sp.]|uniref:hypothetical protein n=1 Tax=Sphingopyxis sp. TaxID=1908224 RepID=UPI00261EC7ED|nr:hypothetical protein [Sphingopyxis sp.]MCW0196760.1 hypothetical protein [Sphingopyxis sp.]